jgi:hypothetical protein
MFGVDRQSTIHELLDDLQSEYRRDHHLCRLLRDLFRDLTHDPV